LKKMIRSGTLDERRWREIVKEEHGDLLWYVAALARSSGLSLNDIALANLRKTTAIWTEPLPVDPRFEETLPHSERLPTSFRATFTEAADAGRVHVLLNGLELGQRPMDDNAWGNDGYRFHDVFHLANAAVLGWSPVLRSLLRRKRKSNPSVDRIEDGGRAIAIEEGLVSYLFSISPDHNDFSSLRDVDWDVIKLVIRMTERLEVSNQPPSAWRRAILDGFTCWRFLVTNQGGTVIGDREARSLKTETS
jgi:hypothetical protein